MKKVLLAIFFLTISCNLYAVQSDSLFCFTKKEITVLANKVRTIEDSITYFRALIVKKDSLIILQDTAYAKAISQLKLYKEANLLWKKKDDEYKVIIKNSQPAWYNNKFIWFGLGVIATVIIAK